MSGISKRLRFAILRRDHYQCYYCGYHPPAVHLVIDHVIPRALGGTDDQDNLVTACVACNSGKADTMPETWLVEKVRKLAYDHPVVPCDDDGCEPSPHELAVIEAEDDAIFNNCLAYLRTLSTRDVLRFVWEVHGLSVYRPTYDEVIRAAATLARREALHSPNPALSLAEGPVS